MSAAIIGNIPLAINLSAHAKKAHIFDGLHSASLISLDQLCDDDCVAILDKNEINILKGKTLILRGAQEQYRWPMGHTHIKNSEASRYGNHH